MASVGLEEDRPDVLSMRRSALKEGWPIVLAAAGGLVCYGLFVNRGLGLSVIGYSVAPSERVLQGEIPYRDFLFNYTPGILWVNALLMKAFGTTLMATRIGLFVFKLATLLTLYHLGRRLTNRWIALVPVVLTLAWLGHQQIFNVFPDQYLMLFALAGLLCMLNYDRTGGLRWLALCGAATGTVFLFKYNVGVLLAASCIAAVCLKELMTFRRLAGAAKAITFYVLGFGIVAGALLAYLFYHHALGAMVSHFLHHAAEYSETRSVGLPTPDVLLPAFILLPLLVIGLGILFGAGRAFGVYWIAVLIVESWFVLEATRGKVFSDSVIASAAYFPPLVFVVALALAAWQLRNKRRVEDWWRDKGAIVITGFFALAVYLEVFPRADYYHLVRVLPPVFLFLVVLLNRSLAPLADFLRRYVTSHPWPPRNALLILATPIVFLCVIGVHDTWQPQFDSAFHFRDNHELAIERGRGIFVEEKQAELTEGLVRVIQDNSSPDDYIFSFAQRGSGLYFLAARRNPTRFLWWRSVGISGEEREAVRTMISNRRAKLIILQDIDANKEIQDFISSNYEHIGGVADIAVYKLKDLEAQAQAAQAQAAQALGAQASLPASSRPNLIHAEIPAAPQERR
ncbi:MAG TPA: glycosyltransferase family 39 protein [Blastocatellia bacterium]|nr:glycosyltransferase family 39 protein [Blastocatellia bacterium]